MLVDPQSITYAAVAKSLAASARGPEQSVYKLSDSGVIYDFRVSHQYKNRNRIAARLQRDSYASDPLVPAQNVLASMTATLVLDFPNVGLTATDVQNLARALRDWASDATLLKIINGET